MTPPTGRNGRPAEKAPSLNGPLDRVPLLFCLLAAAIGICYVLLIPPFQGFDEPAHFNRAYGVSKGACIGPEVTQAPESLRRLQVQFFDSLQPGQRIDVVELVQALAVRMDRGKTKGLPSVVMNLYGCAAYAPAGLAIRIAEELNAPPLLLFYWGRLANLAGYILLTFLALRLLPDFRLILLGVALLPMTLHQAASFSADGISNALSFLLCALILKLSFDDRIPSVLPRHWLAVGVVIVLYALAKPALWLVILVVVIPDVKFGSQLRRWAFATAAIALAVSVTIAFETANLANIHLYQQQRLEEGVDTAANVRFTWQHPLAIAGGMLRTVQRDGTSVLQWFTGSFGVRNLDLPSWLRWSWLALLTLLTVSGASQIRLSALTRLLFLGVGSIGVVFAFLGPNILVSTGTHRQTLLAGNGFLEGLQVRYLIPAAFPILTALSSQLWRSRARGIVAGTAVFIFMTVPAVVGAKWRQHYVPLGTVAAARNPLALDYSGFPPRFHRAAPPLVNGASYGQSFTAAGDGICAVEVSIATYLASIPSGGIRLSLQAEEPGGEKIAEWLVPAATICDNCFVALRFPPQVHSRGRKYRLTMSPEGLPPGFAITVWLSEEDVYSGGQFFASGKPQNVDCLFRVLREPGIE